MQEPIDTLENCMLIVLAFRIGSSIFVSKQQNQKAIAACHFFLNLQQGGLMLAAGVFKSNKSQKPDETKEIFILQQQ